MKKMPAPFKSFSVAILFSLVTACAVDAPDESQSITKDDDAECVECRDADGFVTEDADAQKRREVQTQDQEHLLKLQQAAKRAGQMLLESKGFCAQDADCDSNICDEEVNHCRDYPF